MPSIVGALVRNGERVWCCGAGRVDGVQDGVPDANVQYRCGSITKTFVAVQIMRLRDEGRLQLGDRLERHLPGVVDDVTIAQLLSHSSGLRAETAGRWWERTAGARFDELVTSALHPADVSPPRGRDAADPDLGADAPALTRAGRRFHYSNVGFALLGELIARLRGAPWAHTLQEEVLTPLGMTRTTMRPATPHAQGYAVHPYADILLPEPEHDAGAMAPAGQLWTTAADLCTWMAFLSGHSAAEVLAPATLAEMHEPLTIDDRRDAPWTGAHGLGLQVWNVDGVRSYGHGGSMPGFLAVIRIDAGSGDGIVVMANSTAGMRPALTEELRQIIADHEPRPVREWVPASPAEGVVNALGPWFWGPSPYTLRASGSVELVLDSEPAGGRGSRFRPREDGTWLGLDGYYTGETLRIRRDGDGNPVALELATFVFTRTPYDPQADIPGGVDRRGWGVP